MGDNIFDVTKGKSKEIQIKYIYGFGAKIIAKYETEKKISNKGFFKRKWILTPYLITIVFIIIIIVFISTQDKKYISYVTIFE